MCGGFGHVIGLRAQAQKSFPRGTCTGTLQLLYEVSYYSSSAIIRGQWAVAGNSALHGYVVQFLLNESIELYLNLKEI